MSRIEKAIEMAARKREGDLEKPAPQPQPPVSTPVAPIQRENSSRAANIPPVPNVDIDIKSPFMVMANDHGSLAAEQYRKLKSVIVKLVQMGKLGKSMMVTSAVSGEGKTITSLNLAITLAQEFDHTVLLIEADVRKPSILNYLGLRAERGLSDCINDGVDISEVLVKTGIGSLNVLPAGRYVENPVEMFSSNKMTALFDEIKTRYSDRYIIVDTTPLLPFAEPQYIANVVDGVLLVVREGVTTQEKLKSTVDMLKNNNLVGIVSNGVTQPSSGHGYYGYYGYRGSREG